MRKELLLILSASCSVVLSFASIARPKFLASSHVTFNHAPNQLNLQAANPSVSGGDASLASSTFNLAKSIIGAGVLSLPSGVAFFSDQPEALVPACVICAIFGLAAAYSFSSIGRVCKENNAKSFQEAWSKSVDPNTAWMISGAITCMCFLASLAYSIIIGDSFSSLFQTFNLPSYLSSRPNTILLLSALVLFPLCSLKNLSSLAPFSLLGLGGTLYTALFMGIRFWDKSYVPGGRFFKDIKFPPSFNQRGPYAFNHLTFVLLSMLSTSYVAHYNAPKFFTELQNNTMERFNTVVGGAFVSAIAIFVFVMSCGFLSFGGATQGLVLNNYASSDTLATIARFAIGLAILTGYPFTFSALREGVMDLQGLSGEARERMVNVLTPVMLGLVTAMAVALKDVGFVVSLTGALFGCTIMFVVPSIMNIYTAKKIGAKAGKEVTAFNSGEVLLNYGLVGTGLTMAAVGVAVSILKQMGKL